MRVLHVLTQADEDGASGGPMTAALALCRAAAERGHRTELVAGWVSPHPPPDLLAGVPAHLFPARPLLARSPFVTLWSAELARFLRRELASYDVVHVHLARDLIPTAALLLAGRRGVPVVVQPHGMVVRHPRTAVRALDAVALRRVWSRARGVVALTAAEAADLARVGLPTDDVTIMPNSGPRAPAQTRDRASRGRQVLFLARLHPRKAVLDFAAAARILLDRGVEATFAVCGPDGGDLPRLEAAVARDGLAGHLTYEGAVPRDRVLDRLGAAAVYVTPARDEPFGLALVEAMAVGTPTVSVRPGGLTARIEAAGAGVVVDPEPAALADAVAALLTDDAHWAAVSRRGREWVAAEFPPDANGSAVVAAYARLVPGASPHLVPRLT